MSKFINPFTDVCFMKVEDIVDIASMSKEDRIRYDESIKVYRDRLAIMEFERMKGKAEGIAEGMAQGIAQGKAEGMAEGMAQGKAEGMAEGKEEIARNLKQMGMDVQTIVQATGLDQEVIDKL
ncbi:hypothetical protein [Bacteroides sp. An322]|uniref:hypothetical protein n=1 Tax=Bacteroides sp. An322 TaxID=1965632 RepID=UPI000B391FB5|nr:hypothetical protein [Bacteroides sp. An322]OUO14743.1 hypothetical protein B5F91_13930 [Bacteroides sp. An322]